MLQILRILKMSISNWTFMKCPYRTDVCCVVFGSLTPLLRFTVQMSLSKQAVSWPLPDVVLCMLMVELNSGLPWSRYMMDSIGSGAAHSAPLKVKYQRWQQAVLHFSLSEPLNSTRRALSACCLVNVHSWGQEHRKSWWVWRLLERST